MAAAVFAAAATMSVWGGAPALVITAYNAGAPPAQE